jgi:hypothetical protein
MTPEERNLVIELFDRLATLEDAQRDPEAERLISWLAASPQCALRVGADRAGAGRSAQARGRAHPRARGRGSLSGILMRGVGERIPERLGSFLRAQHSPRGRASVRAAS